MAGEAEAAAKTGIATKTGVHDILDMRQSFPTDRRAAHLKEDQ